jgi:hypothetical protein
MSAAPLARPPKLHANPMRCAEALSAMLREHSPSIATLQESDNLILGHADLSDYEIQRGPIGLTTLIRRKTFRVVENSEIRQRVQVLVLDGMNQGLSDLLVFNLHWPIMYKSEAERRDFARPIVTDMDRVRVSKIPRLEIMAGDFNLPPYDELIVGESGLFANRDLSHISSRRSSVGRALYNASWSIFGGTCGALGTYRKPSIPHGPWQVPDQMLIDPRLLAVSQIKVQVIIKADTVDLHTPSGYPNKSLTSDHFPVLVSITPNEPSPYQGPTPR